MLDQCKEHSYFTTENFLFPQGSMKQFQKIYRNFSSYPFYHTKKSVKLHLAD